MCTLSQKFRSFAFGSLALSVLGCGEGPAPGLPANGGSGGTGASGAGGSAIAGAGGAVAGSGGMGGVPAAGAAGAGPAGAGAGGEPSAGAGGAAGAGSGAGGAGAGGAAGSSMGGAGGSGGSVACTFTVEHAASSAIGTVRIVTWSTDLPSVTGARIEFGLAETGPTMSAPVDLAEPGYRTLLLGMKGARDYVFRIVAESSAGACTSESYPFTTGAVPSSIPDINVQVAQADAAARGFIVTSGGIRGGGGGGASAPAIIMDTDGDVVWWASAPASTSRARMSWDGKDMWMMALNVQDSGGEMRRVSMDGTDVEEDVSGLSDGHHDFTVLPGGIVAAIIHSGNCSAIVERAPDGTITQVVPDVSTIYAPVGDCHPNAIVYYPSDDSYTVSDRNPNLFVKITRSGQIVWQLGGNNPRGNHFSGSWQVNHGHQLLPNGNFLFFNNGNMGAQESPVLEYQLDTSSFTATRVWDYASDEASGTLGDVQRLPNGNTLVTYSNAGVIHEVSMAGQLVKSFSTTSFGYADFRESLYGPPLK